jgi:hypothetical protein
MYRILSSSDKWRYEEKRMVKVNNARLLDYAPLSLPSLLFIVDEYIHACTVVVGRSSGGQAS